MKNKLLVLSLLSLSSTAVYASPFNGVYAGIGVGGSQARFETNQRAEISPLFGGAPIFDIVIMSKPDLTDQSWAGNVELGFSHLFNQHFFIGIEGDADTQDLSDSNPVSVNDSIGGFNFVAYKKAELTNEYAITLDPGLVIGENTLFYAKVGPAWGHFKGEGSAQYNQPIGGLTTLSAANSFSKDKYEDGVRVGLGIERYVSTSFSVKLEYLYTDYGTVHSGTVITSPVHSTTPIPGLGGSLTNSDKVTAKNSSIMLGVNYHFGANA